MVSGKSAVPNVLAARYASGAMVDNFSVRVEDIVEDDPEAAAYRPDDIL